jgi:hypothetical protein
VPALQKPSIPSSKPANARHHLYTPETKPSRYTELDSCQRMEWAVSNIIPITPFSRADADETTIVEQVEQIPGELDVDRVIKAQASASDIAQRVRELEDCLWAVARELLKYDGTSPAAERAKLLLKNRLEIDIRR